MKQILWSVKDKKNLTTNRQTDLKCKCKQNLMSTA